MVEGIGIKIDFIIKLDVDMSEEIDLRENVEISYEEEIEEIKTGITNQIDEKLSDKLEIIDDNLPQNDCVFREIKDEQNTIKVVYFNEEKELSKIAKENNISLDNLFKTNKHTDFNAQKRVIIKYGK